MQINHVYCGKSLDIIKGFPNESIDCVITSPPYWQLRDYKWDGQWGLEPTFQMYLENLWSLMDEIYRVLKSTGTCWINLGDTYGTTSGNMTSGNIIDNKIKYTGGIDNYSKPKGYDKCLLLIPHRFGIGCIDRGWIVRNDIIWAKRNAMPESCTDRFSKKHEYIFLMTKNKKYYFDLDSIRDKNITQENRPSGVERNRIYSYDSKFNRMKEDEAKTFGSPRARRSNGKSVFGGKKGDGQDSDGIYSGKEWYPNEKGKNPGSVSDFWDIPTHPSSDEHYASYNDKLIGKAIIAGCPEKGIILDPFCGTGTTLCRSYELGRSFIGIDGSDDFVRMSEKNLSPIMNQTKLF